jgi:hypothetical protein
VQRLEIALLALVLAVVLAGLSVIWLTAKAMDQSPAPPAVSQPR